MADAEGEHDGEVNEDPGVGVHEGGAVVPANKRLFLYYLFNSNPADC